MAKVIAGLSAAQKHSRAPGQAAGFTIVEVMLVMAIVGFIMVLVIQAIPTLNRNGHNGRRRQDVATILGAVSHWELTNSGNFPISGTDNFMQFYTSKLSYYALGNITSQIGGAGGQGPNNNIDTVQIYNSQVCNGATPGTSTRTGAGYNDVVALYAIETSGAAAPKCQQL